MWKYLRFDQTSMVVVSINQLENIPQEWYIESEMDSSSGRENSSGNRNVFLSQCGLQSTEQPVAFKRMDFCQSKLYSLRRNDGNFKYPQLFALARCFLSPSDKNSVPERGFSIKKFLLNVYGPSIKEATIISVRLVKDELFRVGDVMKVEINIEI